MTICCADIGSIAKGNFGWASRSDEPDREESSGDDIKDFAALVASCLGAGEKVSMGFECPLWIPVAHEPCSLMRAGQGEGSRAWSAAAGSSSLATGLAEVAWTLDQIRRGSQDAKAFLDWSRFQRSQSGLFIWEAVVTGSSKTGSHESDAMAAVNPFQLALPDLEQERAVVPTSRTRSLIGAALLWAGWSKDVRLLHTPCLVIWAR